MRMRYPYFYAWHPRGKYKNLYKQRCRVLARGAMNSALVEFRSGRREIISRNALRKFKPTSPRSFFYNSNIL